MKPIFAIMVTYRRFDAFKATVESLLPTLPNMSSIAIVYNTEGKHEDDGRYIQCFKWLIRTAAERGIDVNILDTKSNDGWGKAMNEGLRVFPQWKKFEYVLETNNDVTYESDWAPKAKDLLELYPEIGILGLWKHPHHGVRETKEYLVIKDNMPAVAWLFRSKDLETFLPFAEKGACKTRGGNGEDSDMVEKVQALGKWVAAPVDDLAHHMDGYDDKLGQTNEAYI